MKKATSFLKFKIQQKSFKSIILLLVITFTYQAQAQQNITIFDEILYYDGYAGLVEEDDLYEPIPAEVLRHNNARYARKLTDTELDNIGNVLEIEVTLKAACDNYDRLAHIFLAFVEKGENSYELDEVERIEMGRFITPFMNKNSTPNNVPYLFQANNIAEILTNQDLRDEYDFWVELEVFGVPYAAQEQVSGCAGRIDTFYASLNFISETDSDISYSDDMVFMPLAAREDLNNYNNTDVPDETTKIIDFELEEEVENATLYLITSNHGANENGEEYIRRKHYVYLDDNLIRQYTPGGKSCEPYRQYNTQGNGIFGIFSRPLRGWIEWNNWCPGDVIPTREIELGALSAGQHTFKIDVPDAVFSGGEGYIPVSVYLQNRDSGNNEFCYTPTNLSGEISNEGIEVFWNSVNELENWEILYGKYDDLGDENNISVSDDPESLISELEPNTAYQIFVRANCSDLNSLWSEPIILETNNLSVSKNDGNTFTFFPNPTQDKVFLNSKNEAIQTLHLVDIQGRKILTKTPETTTTNLNIENLPNGVYFIKVTIANNTRSYKILKE